jgi:hypothetical protein
VFPPTSVVPLTWVALPKTGLRRLSLRLARTREDALALKLLTRANSLTRWEPMGSRSCYYGIQPCYGEISGRQTYLSSRFPGVCLRLCVPPRSCIFYACGLRNVFPHGRESGLILLPILMYHAFSISKMAGRIKGKQKLTSACGEVR